jgi:competence protein ComEA
MSSINNRSGLKNGRSFNASTTVSIFLIVIIIIGSIIIWTGHSHGRGIEISLETENTTGEWIYVGGAVNNPGLYPLRAGDTIDEVLKAAGGPTASADTGQLELSIAGEGATGTPQKVDINQADVWLLAALPGIGETRAQAIVGYRQKNGLFRDTNELLKVPGIGAVTLEGIKNLITVHE